MALLIAGVDENGPALFHTDPSGTFIQYEAKAIGAGSEGAQSALQDKYSKVPSCLSTSTHHQLLTVVGLVFASSVDHTEGSGKAGSPHPQASDGGEDQRHQRRNRVGRSW